MNEMNAVDGLTKGGSMLAASAVENAEAQRKRGLTEFQRQSVEMFVRFAIALSMPRSIGELYGLLMAVEKPLTLDDVTSLLEMSRGSANQGLRWLRHAGAIRSVYLPGVRREHFLPEMELRRLAGALLRDRVELHVKHGQDCLDALAFSAMSEGTFEKERVDKLRRWHSALQESLPVLKAMFDVS